MTGSNGTTAVVRSRTGGECRVSERFACDREATCQPPSAWKGGGREWPARVRNVSTSGLCLVLGRRFEPGAGLAIEVPGTDDGSASTLLARVVRVQAEGPGSWTLGCAFVSPLSEEEIFALAGIARSDAPLAAGGAFLTDVYFRGTLPHHGVVERLIRKLYVKDPWPPPPGRTISLRFQAFSNDPPVRVRVDAYRSAGGRWILEGTFVDPAPAGLRPRHAANGAR